jgi:putative oxidoreductase
MAHLMHPKEHVIDFGLFVIRVVVGLTFAGHGAQKLSGWWGGPGMDRWTGVMEGMGERPPRLWATISSLNEAVGGLLLAIGLLAPVAAVVLVAQSTVIIARVHWPKGFWATNGGLEYPLVMGAGALGIALAGPGAWAIDQLLAVDVLYQPIVIWLMLAIAMAVALLAIIMRSAPPPQPQA